MVALHTFFADISRLPPLLCLPAPAGALANVFLQTSAVSAANLQSSGFSFSAAVNVREDRMPPDSDEDRLPPDSDEDRL